MSYKFLFIFISLASVVGCGYSFQSSKSPLLRKVGIRKVYLTPIVNNTYKPGIENVVYNDLVRTLTAQGAVLVVQNSADADAILVGSVGVATYVASASTSVAGLNPQSVAQILSATGASNGTNIGGFPIATEYMATLSCSFTMTSVPRLASSPLVFKSNKGIPLKRFGPEREGVQLKNSKVEETPTIEGVKPYSWAAGFTRTKTFPGSNQLDVPGTTSALINDSEFERALGDLSRSMMFDVNESMLSMF